VDAAAAQALGQFIGDGIAVIAIAGVIWQLSMQRQELRAQREQSAAADEDRRQEAESRRKRDELLEQQLADMRLEREAATRRQANQVAVKAAPTRVAPHSVKVDQGDFLHGVEVTNRSDRPIWNVRGGIRLGDAQYAPASIRYEDRGILESLVGGWPIADIANRAEDHRVETIRPVETWVFGFSYSANRHPQAELVVRFVDAAGLEWQVDADMHLSPIKPDEWMS
jgi:hypothetical protein